MITRWLVVASTGEDWEAWFARPPDDDPDLAAWFRRVCAYVQPLMLWDAQHPAQVETWPEYREQVARRFGWTP